MSSLLTVMRTWQNVIRKYWLVSLNRRVPSQSKITLEKNQIFIFPTRYGFVCFFILLALFFGGVNYANSLILMITFWLAGMCLMSLFHTFYNLLGLKIEGGKAQPCYAGEDAIFQVKVTRVSQKDRTSLRLYWRSTPGVLINLVDQKTALCGIPVKTQHRGLLKPGRLCVETTYPIGLLRAWTWVDLQMECWVYPRPIKQDWAGSEHSRDEQNNQHFELGADDFDSLKAYQPGDPLKHVHWKTYARTDQLYSKNFIAPVGQDVWLDWEYSHDADLERRLSGFSYWIEYLYKRQKSFGLKLPNQTIEVNQGLLHYQKCLESLAQYQHATYDELGRSL